MSVQMATRANASIIGELLEAPAFQTTAKGDKYARIRLQTSDHFFSNGERKVSKTVHSIIVHHPLCVKLLESFGKPGIHFLAEGRINSDKDVVVGQFGGQLLLMYTNDAEAPTSKDSSPEASGSQPTGGTAASKPSGGIGRLNTARANNPATSPSQTRVHSDESLDDDIPF